MVTLLNTFKNLLENTLNIVLKRGNYEGKDQVLLNYCVSLSDSFKKALIEDVEFKEESMQGQEFLELLQLFIQTISYTLQGIPEDKFILANIMTEILYSLAHYMVQRVSYLQMKNASLLDIETKYISEQKVSDSALSKLTKCRKKKKELRRKLDEYSNNPEEVKKSLEASDEIRTEDSQVSLLRSSPSDENPMIKSLELNLKMATKLVQRSRESRVDRTRSIQQHQLDDKVNQGQSEQINQLAKRMEEMSQQLAQYTARSDRSEAENREIKAKNQDLVKRIGEVTNQLAQNIARCDLFEINNQVIKAENDEIKARCNKIESQNKQIKGRFNQISAENKDFKDIKERFDQIVAENKEIKAKYDKLKEERKEMPEKKNKKTAEFSGRLDHITWNL